MIDLDQGLVSGPNGASGLTPRAEDLLLLLSRRANTLVSREDILETVWAGRVVEDAAITNCVWQIRRALGPDGKDILQTRTKRGYVLVVADSAWLRAFSESAPAILPLPIRPKPPPKRPTRCRRPRPCLPLPCLPLPLSRRRPGPHRCRCVAAPMPSLPQP
jgi:DNA-binding winged helix-turn-helix (wHTH) protein